MSEKTLAEKFRESRARLSRKLDKPNLWNALGQLWVDEELCDCVLVSADQQKFQAHRLILAATSQYCKALFVGTGQIMSNNAAKHDEHGKVLVQLDEVDSCSLQLLLHAIYKTDFELSEDILPHILPAAAYLQVDLVLSACHKFLDYNCSPASCIRTLVLAERYSMPEVYLKALSTAVSNPKNSFTEKQQEDFLMLSRNAMRHLLRANWQHGISGCEAVLLWADADPAVRSNQLPDLLNAMNSRGQLCKHSDAISHLPCSLEVHQALLQWIAKQQRHLEACASDSTCTQDTLSIHQNAACSQLLIAGGHDVSWQSLRSVELYDIQHDSWSRGVPIPQRESFASCAVVQGQVALLGGGMHNCSMTFYDPGAQCWRPARAPHPSRVHSAVASILDGVLVLGGRTGYGALSEMSRVEFCDHIPSGTTHELTAPAAMRWQLTADMTVPRTCLAAAAVGDSLYAVGGQAGREIWDTVELYDAQQDAWRQLAAHMHTGRKYTSAASLHGRLYVAGGMTSTRTRLASVEAYDPREGKWSLVADMGVARSSAGIAALADCLYAVGGNAGDDWIHTSVEMYVPAAGKWLQRAPIAFARSSLAIAAL